MYLSRIPLNIMRTEYGENLHKAIHGTLESSQYYEDDGKMESYAEGERKRKLWRLDRIGGKDYILLVSKEKPDLRKLSLVFSKDENAGETKDYDRFLSSIKKDQKYAFRLTANPVVHKTTPRAITDAAGQKKWLIDRDYDHGFKIIDLRIEDSKMLYFTKKKDTVTILSVTYEGTLIVKDVEKVKEALVSGIGRGKAYGNGLLTLIKTS